MIHRSEESAWAFETKAAYLGHMERQDLRTLQGERVRSFEELQIANWLYLSGLAYDYEPIYAHPLPDTGRKAYTPDFRLRDSGVYIEHFGVRKARGPNGHEGWSTAPHVDREAYLAGMAWKRAVHAKHGTLLVETFSQDRVEGRLTQALHERLSPHVTLAPLPPDQVFARLDALGQIDGFTQVLGTFLRHFKGAGLTLAACQGRIGRLVDGPRGRAFLALFAPVLAAYQARLGDRIDFEDMIARATAHVKAGRYRSPYRHLLVDEFQDLSAARADLLLALKGQHADARIFAVGDDWQSIYRFAGSDIHLMRRFGAIFGGCLGDQVGVHRMVNLGRTFRSVDRIALPARAFVRRNPAQLDKTVVPAGLAAGPAICVAWVGKGQEAETLAAVLGEIAAAALMAATSVEASDATPLGAPRRKVGVLLLGRTNAARPKALAALEGAHPSLTLRFRTIHAAKGREADHVILLHADAGRLGLPSEIVDNPLLALMQPEPERFAHAEERRVFYVALTRAKASVTLLASEARPSVFVTELLGDPGYGVVEWGPAQPTRQYRCGDCSGRLINTRTSAGGVRFVCEHGFLCGAVWPACPACGVGLPVRGIGTPATVRCACGAVQPACPACAQGWMVERMGRYGLFMGCVRYPRCGGGGSKRVAGHAD